MQERCATPAFLLISVLIVAPLIPGGPIDNRVFPEVPVFVALISNMLVAILIISAVFLAFRTRRGGRQALHLAAWEGGAFASIYLLDLLEIYPVSTTPMGTVTKMFEIAGLAAGILLLASAMRDLRRPIPATESLYDMTRGERASLIALAVYVGAAITIIATLNSLFQYPGYHLWYGTR